MDATTFGPYRLEELIGRGGMGEVYRAYDSRTDRVVALKVLPSHLAKDAIFQQRFRRESQAAAGINEPHVVPIHGFGEIDDRLYLDMRLIDGRNLGTMLGEDDLKQPLKPALAVSIIEQVAAALDAAHELGLIHRDVKPSNILVTNHDFAYLIDFGLARTAGQQGLTTAGSTLGTMAYMSPERFEGGDIDPRSDIYALTCVLYECLTGSRPYPVDSLEQQIAQHINAPAPKPSALDPKLAAFDEVIAKGMAKKPGRRYQTAGEMAAAARVALSVPVRTTGGSGRHSANRVKKTPRTGVSARALAMMGAAVLLGAALVFGAWQLWGGRSDGGSAGPTSTSASPGPSDGSGGLVPAIAATLPPDIKESGRLTVGVNVPYAPNEFKNSAGDIVGFDVDLMNAVAKTLGLIPEYREFLFEDIMPTVQRGEINVGMSSFTDTLERQEQVDFVTYFEAGTLWAQRTGSGIDPNAACGLRVGMTPGSTHETVEIPAKSDQCVAAGLPPVEAVDLRPAGRAHRGADQRGDRRDVGGLTGDGVRHQGQRRRTGTRGRAVRHRALRVAGAEGVSAGRVAAAGTRARHVDRRVQGHRRQMGRGQRHDRQTGDKRRDQLGPPGRREHYDADVASDIDLLKRPVIAVAVGTTAVAVGVAEAGYQAVGRIPVVGSLVRRGVSELSGRGDQFVAQRADEIRAVVTTLAVRIVDTILDELDLTDLVRERLDIDAVVADIDIDAIINRIDLITLADKVIAGVDLPGIIRESTNSVTAEVMDDVRSQGERADDRIAGIVDRVLGRGRDEQ